MVHNTEQAFVAMPMPTSRAKTQGTMSIGLVGTALSLALTGREAARTMLTAFIAYGQNLQATGGSMVKVTGNFIYSLALIGRSTSNDQAKGPMAPFAAIKVIGISAVTMLPGPPFITTFLVNSLSAATGRGYRTIWQFLQSTSASQTYMRPGVLFEQFLWAARSAIKAFGRTAEVGTLPLMGKVLTIVRARRSLGVSPLTMPGGQILIAWKTYPGIVRNALLSGRSKSRLLDGLADYVGVVYFRGIIKTITRVRLFVTGRIPFPQSFSLTKVSMRNRGPVVITHLTGHSDIRDTREGAIGAFLTLAIVAGSAVARAGGMEAISVMAWMTGQSESVVRAKTVKLFSGMKFYATSKSEVVVRAFSTARTYLRARTKSVISSSVPVIFGTFLLLRGKVKMVAHASAQTMAAKVVLQGFSAIRDRMDGLTRYAAQFGARSKSQVKGRMPILPFQVINLPETVSAFVSQAGATMDQLQYLAASAWQGLMGNLTPMSWPVLPNMQPGRHVCNSHGRVRYVYRNILDQDECECQS